MVVTFPQQLQAQISTTKAEKYTLFTVVRTLKCNFMPPGTQGSAQTWNFSGLTPKVTSDTTRSNYFASHSGLPFQSATMVRHRGNRYTFYDYNSSGVYEVGTLDSTNNPPDTISHTDSKRIMMLPMTYTDIFTDTFTVDGGTKINGGGNITDTVESFGKLILPGDTFENVIRMYITEDFTGTILGAPGSIHRGTFLWFDKDHSSPLLRLDSTITTTGIGTNTMTEIEYLIEEDPVAVAEVAITKLPVTAIFSGNDLVLTSGTENGHRYNLSLYTIAGRKVYNTSFVANGQQRFNINSISAGVYMLAIDDADHYGTIGVLKVVKQ